MTDEFSPRLSPSGPILDDLDATVQQLVTAAPVVVNAAANGEVFGAGGISFATTKANQRVQLTVSLDRDNSAAAGFGQYSFEVDGVAVSPIRTGSTDLNQTVSFTQIVTVAAAGVHEANVRLAATTGNETVTTGATLIVNAS